MKIFKKGKNDNRRKKNQVSFMYLIQIRFPYKSRYQLVILYLCSFIFEINDKIMTLKSQFYCLISKIDFSSSMFIKL